jgi:DNA-binding LacI/PurR family transcriptional regulator
MLYANRGADGVIVSISRQPQAGAQVVSESDPEVKAFIAGDADAPSFDSIDADFVRVIEDVIDTLIKTQVIRLTDLPEAAQRKLNQRKGMRSRLHGALDLIGRDDGIL